MTDIDTNNSPRAQWQRNKGNHYERTLKIEDQQPPGRCAWCWEPIKEKRRRVYCSEACSDEYKVLWSPSAARWRVEQRDKGVCAQCGLDTEWLKNQLHPKVDHWHSFSIHRFRDPEDALRQATEKLERLDQVKADIVSFIERIKNRGAILAQYPWAKGRQHFWEANHKTAVTEGGGAAALDDLETLCLGCHQQHTKALRGRLSRKPSKGYNVFEKGERA